MNPDEIGGALASVDRDTLSERVYRALHEAIVHGSLTPGAELNQVTLAKDFGVSRVPVREALRRLDAEGLVQNTPYQKYVVTSLTPERVEELLELRTELEVLALRRLMKAEETPDTAALSELVERMSSAPDPRTWLRLDREFHWSLCGATSETAALAERIRDRIQHYLRDVAGTESRRREAEEEHRLILEALEEGDTDGAESLIRTHISRTREAVIGPGDGSPS